MPLFDYKCDSCGEKSYDVFRHITNIDEECKCPKCGKSMRRLFPKSTHVLIDGSMDSVPVGKKIREKNDQLKAKWAGYSYEQDTMKEKIGSAVQEKLKRSGRQ